MTEERVIKRSRGRPKQYYKYQLPTGVVKVVQAQCADFERKRIALKNGGISDEVRKAYEEINAIISEALEEVEEACRKDFLKDIAENHGWNKSSINWMLSQGAYYNRKWKVVYEIARKMFLI
jgi:hypothetical protein